MPRLRRVLAITGAAWAVLLIILQAFVIDAWCKLCLVADPAAIGYALAVLAGAATLRATIARGLAVIPAVVATVGALALWTHHDPEPELQPALPDGTAGVHSLPTLFIGGERIVGDGNSTEELTAMLDRATIAR
jgi:hypothetical protein